MKLRRFFCIIICLAMMLVTVSAYAAAICSSCGQPTPTESWHGECQRCTGCCTCSTAAETSGIMCPKCGKSIPHFSISYTTWCSECNTCADCCVHNCYDREVSYYLCTKCGARSLEPPAVCFGCGGCAECCSCESEPQPEDSTDCSSLDANIKVSDREVAVNEEVTFTASWSGGEGPYSVQILAINTEIGDGTGVSGNSNYAEALSWSVSFPKAGTYVGQVRVTDANHDTVTAQTKVITVGGSNAPTQTEEPQVEPTPKPVKPSATKKLKIDYIKPTTVSTVTSSVIVFDIGISGAKFPCKAIYEITDEVTGKKTQIEQDGINSETFQLMLGPEVSGAVKIAVKVTDSVSSTDKKEQSTTAGKTTDATAETGRLRITGITPASGSEMTEFTATIAGGTPPFSMSYNLKYAQAGEANVWSGSIGNERIFKMMTHSSPIEKIVLKVTDSKGVSATKEYKP